jgi:ELWxxDGT repeat protein
MVRNIAYNYIDAYNGGSHPYSIVRVGNIVYFLATTPDTGTELWRSNGSPTGTVLVKDLVPGPGSSGIYNLTNVNGTLYFTNSDATAGNELWKSDGTAAGTARVKDIEPGTSSSSPAYSPTSTARSFSWPRRRTKAPNCGKATEPKQGPCS